MKLGERVGYHAARAVFRGGALWQRVRTGASYDPLARRHKVDPYPAYRRLRARDPVHRIPLLPGWAVARHEDVASILHDPCFSADERNWKRWPGVVRRMQRAGVPDPYAEGFVSMLRLDPPDHTRLRGLVSRAFTPRAVERMRPRIEAIVKERLAGVRDGEMELVGRLAAPLPVIVIAELLGVPADDHERFRHWSDEIVLQLGETSPEDARRSLAARNALRAYFTEIVEARRREPRADLVSALVAVEEQGDRLRLPELLGVLLLLLVAGNETTTKLIGNAVLALLRHPEQLALLREDPARIPAAVEECLRFDSPVQLTSRMVLEDGELRGHRLRRGEQVVLLLGSANRDEAVFPGADRLDVTRENAARHLSFGHGVHHCLGAPLARLEAACALSGLLERFPRLALAVETVDWSDNEILRGPVRLPLRVGGRA
jgi:cytochrome P450